MRAGHHHRAQEGLRVSDQSHIRLKLVVSTVKYTPDPNYLPGFALVLLPLPRTRGQLDAESMRSSDANT